MNPKIGDHVKYKLDGRDMVIVGTHALSYRCQYSDSLGEIHELILPRDAFIYEPTTT